MPFFRDHRGTLCAMAYLIERSGRRDLVDRIASTRNNARSLCLVESIAFMLMQEDQILAEKRKRIKRVPGAVAFPEGHIFCRDAMEGEILPQEAESVVWILLNLVETLDPAVDKIAVGNTGVSTHCDDARRRACTS